ncbi:MULTISPECIES: HoxN/HupN/NixA family nickel/cobalt transporter [unclassified Mycolicibacterium]|uniref:HoxN/HupN/NixA family nickel/cobalt transporter n=1 Tax=unclassified Mycolicibacterium TaxID=2636767 RepID=UPI002EDA0808
MPARAPGPISVLARLVRSWNRRDWTEFGALAAAIAALHIVGFGSLLLLVAPHHYQVGTQVFGIGLGITAYTFGLRHAFDADHIAAIDNTTRKLTADGAKPKSVGFWFAMGHSMMVLVMAVLVVVATKVAGELIDDGSATRHALGIAGTLASGLFLWLIGIINVVALVGIWRVFTAMRRGQFKEEDLEEQLDNRGLLARILRPVMKRIKHPIQMFPVGVLFGLGFDTATEVALLALAGTGAAAGLPWFAVLTLPVLFAAGMSLMDTADGLFMTVAYDWAFANPVRKIYYNLTITGLSVAVALLIGSIELISVLHDDLDWVDPVSDWISSIDLNNFGFVIVGLFVTTWVCAVAYWRLSGIERRWQTDPACEE